MTAAALAPAPGDRAPGDAGRKPGFRRDIQGLRAIAVVLVVLYHSGVDVLSGGYVGVDVFFVISGFLITTHLLGTLERTGRIPFGQFYAQRARRILPAALLVAGLTVIAAWIWMSPLLLEDVVQGAIAAALYVPNLLFAQQGTDYLAETTPSVMQHYWSLGVEEQFYLFWPLVLTVAFRLCRGHERTMMAGAALLTAGSFLACVLLMDVSQPWTFFSLPTRAWELGVGALLAFLLRSRARWLRSARTGLLAWVGLAALAAVALGFDEGTEFPGWRAAIPVLATALVIIGGTAPGRLHATSLLGLRPLQFLGAISYSLYLVHWPLQVIPQAATFAVEPLPQSTRLLLAGVAVPVAWLSYRFVERPVIGWRSLRARPPLVNGILAGAASLSLIAVAGGVHLATVQQPLATERPAPAAGITVSPAGTDYVPVDLSPALEAASADNPAVYANGCHRTEHEDDPGGCRVGENTGAPLVFLFGDSHAASWHPALERLALEGRIRLDTNTKSSCYSLDIEQELEDRPYTTCEVWRDGVIERIDAEQPDLVILANYHNENGPLVGGNGDLEARWHEGLASTLSRISGPEVAVMTDVPDQGRTPRLCLAKNVATADECAVPRSAAFQEGLLRAEASAVADGGAHHVDLTGYFCNAEFCPTIVGSTLVYRDSHHLTATFSRKLAPVLWEQIAPLTS